MADPVEFQFICKPFNVIHEYEIPMDAHHLHTRDFNIRMQ